MICVLGCLDSKSGLVICKEMLSWLKPEHDVLEIHQPMPGSLYEYPALNYVIRTAIDMNEPVLYLHTKGAGNPIPPKMTDYILNEKIKHPKEVKPGDCQKTVRNMWKHEFTGERLNDYLKVVNTNEPYVACPLTGKEKVTWQNGFIINPAAAKILKNSFHLSKNRYYYENMFCKTSIKVVGLISNSCHRENKIYQKIMWNYIWPFFNLN